MTCIIGVSVAFQLSSGRQCKCRGDGKRFGLISCDIEASLRAYVKPIIDLFLLIDPLFLAVCVIVPVRFCRFGDKRFFGWLFLNRISYYLNRFIAITTNLLKVFLETAMFFQSFFSLHFRSCSRCMCFN